MNKIILIDADDVLNNLADEWIKLLNQKYDLAVSINDMNSWGIEKYFPTLTKDQIYKPLDTSEFWNNLKPTYLSQSVVKSFLDDGFIVKVVTATHYNNTQYKAEWLNYYFPFIGWKNTIITAEKQYIYGDVQIDDGLHNFSRTRALNLLVDKPWNQHATIKHVRVSNWSDINHEINKYKEVMRYK